MKYRDFYNLFKTKYPILTRKDIKNMSRDMVLDIQLSDWVKKGFLVKPRKDIYLLEENANINPYMLANRLFQPSYVSLESALFYYGFIPDVTVAATSITTKKTRRFEFKDKLFIYQKIKSNTFLGYQEIKDKNWSFLIALPEKAVLDYFYLNLTSLKNKDSWQELRFDARRYMETIDRAKLFKLLKLFNSEKLTDIVKHFDKYLRQEK